MTGKEHNMLQKIVCWIGMLLVMGSLYATDAQENQSREILRIGNGLNVPAVWREDEKVFARIFDDGEVHFYSPDGEWLNSISLTDEPMNTSIGIFWSPDDTRAAFRVTTCPDSGSCSELFSVWNISEDGRTAQIIFTVESGGSVTWKPDSQQVAFGGRIYDAATGEVIYEHLYELATWNSSPDTYSIAEYNHGPGGPLVWSPDGTQYVGIDYALIHGQAYAIFIDNGTVIPLSESYSDPTPQFLWSPDGKLLTDGYRAWDAQTGALLSGLHDGDKAIASGMLNKVNGFWHPEGNLIYTLDQQSMEFMPSKEAHTKLYVWNPQTGEPSHIQPFYRYIRKLFWRGNELLATADDNWELTLNPETGEVTSAKPLDILITPDSLAWSPDSSKLVIASDGVPNFPLQVWDIAAMRFKNQSAPLWTVHNDWFAFETEAAQYGTGGVEVRWTPDGNEIVTLATDYSLSRMFNAVERWRIEDGQSAGRIAFETTYIMPLVDPSPDLQRSARYFSMMVGNNRVEILEGEAVVSVLPLFDEEAANFIQVAWKPDGKQLAVSVSLESETIQIWDVESNPPQLIQSIAHSSYPKWSSTGRYLVMQGTIYDPSTGRVILEMGKHYRYYRPTIVWNPDDTFFAFRAEDEIQFWNMTTQQIIEHIPVEDGCCLPRAWSPDGTMLALTAQDGTIRIWDVSGFNE